MKEQREDFTPFQTVLAVVWEIFWGLIFMSKGG